MNLLDLVTKFVGIEFMELVVTVPLSLLLLVICILSFFLVNNLLESLLSVPLRIYLYVKLLDCVAILALSF